MSHPSYAIGVDYGTSSVRALVVRTSDGAEIGTSVWPYAHGTDGVVLDPNNALLARQHPQDYIDGLLHSIKGALDEAKKDKDFSVERVVGIGVDTTGSSPLPVDENNVPLACRPEFQNNPDAMTWLWKDHTSYAEAAEITSKSNELGFPYMKMVGGTYSSEWFWRRSFTTRVWRQRFLRRLILGLNFKILCLPIWLESRTSRMSNEAFARPAIRVFTMLIGEGFPPKNFLPPSILGSLPFVIVCTNKPIRPIWKRASLIRKLRRNLDCRPGFRSRLVLSMPIWARLGPA